VRRAIEPLKDIIGWICVEIYLRDEPKSNKYSKKNK
jgi:hypothetical protein